MSTKLQINRWVLSQTSTSPNFGKFLLRHDDDELLFDVYELKELMAVLRVAENITDRGKKD